MFVISGIFTMILIIVIEYFLGVYASFTILGFSLGVVFPVGCYFIGLVISYILAQGIKKSGRKLNKFHYGFAIFLSVATFLLSGFIWYRATYVDAANGFNVNRNGIPIRKLEFVDTSGNSIDMSYTNYFTYEVDKTNFPNDFKNGSTIVLKSKEVEKVPTYLIQIVALILSALISLKGTMINESYCENCKKYYKNKTLFKFPRIKYHSEISELEHRLKSHQELDSYIINKRKEKFKDNNYYKVQLQYCTSCDCGHIALREFESHNFRTTENKEKMKLIEIDSEAVKKIL